MHKHIWTLVLIILLLGWAVFIDRLGDRFIFEPSKEEQALSLPFEPVRFNAPSGQALSGLYLPAKPGKDTILFFHGNAYNVTAFQEFAHIYTAYGYGVLLFDYRGYGRSEGTPSERRMYQDGQAALNYLLNIQKIPPQQLVLWGYSLGNAVALQIALDNELPLKALILQSPFTSTSQMGAFFMTGHYKAHNFFQRALRYILWPALVTKQFDNTAKIGDIKLPLLIGFSSEDKVIPWQMSRDLAALGPQHTQTYLSPMGQHMDFEWMQAPAIKFLQHLKAAPTSSAHKS